MSQARALVDHRFTSLDIPYPGAFLDPAREFFPMRPPFIMVTCRLDAGDLFTGVGSASGRRGGGGGLARPGPPVDCGRGRDVVCGAEAVAQPVRDGRAVVLGLGTPLWFYADSGWEHAPGVACGAAGFACAVRSRSRAAPLLAGLFVGAGATLRDEVVLLMPGLLIAVWWRTRSVRSLAAAAAGVLIPLAVAASMEVWWFERPAAAHLRHAVHLSSRRCT